MFYFLLYFIITFVITFLIYLFLVIKKNKKYNPNAVPVEVNLILLRHNIQIEKLNYKKFLYVISISTSLVVSLAIAFIFCFFEKVYLEIIFSVLLILVLIFIVYDFIGSYYEKKFPRK